MKLSELPAVHELLTALHDVAPRFPHQFLIAEIRAVVEEVRLELRGGAEIQLADVSRRIRQRLADWERPSLRHVINATGVVLHTNLGRAPLPGESYSNLEYDLTNGRRGKRDIHAGRLLHRLLGMPAIVVNNNAAAVYLTLRTLAAGKEVIVSRGELVEIGDSFRIPDIMSESGAILREVGATNRTTINDYAAAITSNTALLMIVHPSNFRMQGFTAKPGRHELAELGRNSGIPVYEDLGSGCFADLSSYGIAEPRVQEAIADGLSVLSFSGDKLLGGPQAGIIAGHPELITRIRRQPMFRALRVDKLILAELEATLRGTLLERWDDIPALKMIRANSDELRTRADRIAAAVGGSVIQGESVIGGGSTPDQSLPAWLVALSPPDVVAVERRLRSGAPPVVARIENGRLLLDPRTVFESEEDWLIAAVREAAGKPCHGA
ncbi:MAG: L-seryl-tRNA(Sec) selenium transferase [Bryobacterales bacterium]|nr:L-seryl-tRNA(Sec) selenium transferase [Bryobacterales bacterium]